MILSFRPLFSQFTAFSRIWFRSGAESELQSNLVREYRSAHGGRFPLLRSGQLIASCMLQITEHAKRFNKRERHFVVLQRARKRKVSHSSAQFDPNFGISTGKTGRNQLARYQAQSRASDKRASASHISFSEATRPVESVL